jgi:hypothetical protein
MGAITRSAANNITTSGVILPAGINDASVASISALAQVSAGDGITLISSQTASASASLSFTTGIDSTYKTYLFKFINMHPQTNAVRFLMNLSTDGGSSYNVTKTSSFFQASHDEADSATNLNYDGSHDLAQGTGYQDMHTSGIGNDNDQSCSGYMYLFSPSNTTFVKHFLVNNNIYFSSDYTINSFIGGYGNTTSAINAVDFKMSSGNIDAGTIYMYGIN